MSTGILEVVRRLGGATAKTTAVVATAAVEKVIQAFERNLDMDVQDCDVKITALRKEIAGLETEYRAACYDSEISDVTNTDAEARMEKIAAELRRANARIRNLKSARERAAELKQLNDEKQKEAALLEKRRLRAEKAAALLSLGGRLKVQVSEVEKTLREMEVVKGELFGISTLEESRQQLANLTLSIPTLINHQLRDFGFKAGIINDVDLLKHFPQPSEFTEVGARFYE